MADTGADKLVSRPVLATWVGSGTDFQDCRGAAGALIVGGGTPIDKPYGAGDKGYYTEDGSIFLCGRFKELIKCMDQQVYPAELEELLASDPEVRHVIVAGVPHSQYVEAARAFVVHQRRLTDPLEQQKEAERLKKLVAGESAVTFDAQDYWEARCENSFHLSSDRV
ncbi:hypothetical protein HPB52_019153 [Rhipicephalus sanguineus]|uniref:AMP-binding enzyme C-terminal domain-containing protein n=1 Tax=Rhipicephalus sanguineus TaxID=34632 RepID=A0A9D4TBE0_RHISA|nr:hypothetical protein HPB52_019153 [Rhipicephalus sanguineus]